MMDAEGILAMENAAMERWRKGDPWGWTEISADDVTYFDPFLTKPVNGLTEYKDYLKQAEGNVNYQVSEFIDPKVDFFGNTAVLSYNYRSCVLDTDGSEVSQMLWNTTEVYFKRAADWQIVHTHWSFVNHRLPNKLEIPLPVELSPVKYSGILGELMPLESAAMERWRKGDPWGFVDLYAPGITYMDSGTPARINGLDAMKAEYKLREGKIHYDVQEFIDPIVQVLDDTAVLTYRFFATTLNLDGSIQKRMPWNCTEVYVKSNGLWRIVHNHWSLIKGERI
jgi:ketosteroid isomerase-like protein